jgi:hypothetical protein
MTFETVVVQILQSIFSFFDWIFNAVIWVINAIGGLINWLVTGIADIITAIANFFGGAIQILIDVIYFIVAVLEAIINFIGDIVAGIIYAVEIVFLVIQLVLSLIGIITTYIGQAVTLFFNIVTTINTAPFTPLPGMPQCVTAPQNSQICAVWYIFDYTLFSPGTPGTLIIPLLVLIVDLFLAFFIIKYVFALVKDVQSLFGVS